MILLLAGEKGGIGKSTLSTNLAAYLAGEGADIMLLDADPQATATKWINRRKQLNSGAAQIHSMQKIGDVFDAIRDIAKRYEHVIINTGGRDSEEMRTALATIHKVYVPLRPSQADIETSVKLNELVKQGRAFNRNLLSKILLSQCPTSPFIGERLEAVEVLEELDQFQLSPNFISERKVYRDAIAQGVTEMKNRKATAEIQLLAQEIYDD